MTNDEARMTNDKGMMKCQAANSAAPDFRRLNIRYSFGLGHSSVIIL
jgi:hypothetical protein